MKKIFYLLAIIVVIFLAFSMLRIKNPSIADYTDSMVCPVSKKAGNIKLHGKDFEDYVLSVVFAHKSKGSYIDVGASSPYDNSITRYFYENGWRGINIEPVQKWHQEFLKARPEDVSLNVGVANESGAKNFYRIFAEISQELDGFSTFDEDDLKDALKGGKKYDTSEIQVMTLNQVLASHPIEEIDFLALNVSRKEMEILAGLNLSKHRPAVIVIEAPKPEQFSLTGHEWDSFLERNKYRFVMFDGINSYYVATEHYDILHKNFLRAYDCVAEANKKDHVVENRMVFVTSVK